MFNGGSFMEATVQVVSIPTPSTPSVNTMVVLGEGTVCMESGVAELTFGRPPSMQVLRSASFWMFSHLLMALPPTT